MVHGGLNEVVTFDHCFFFMLDLKRYKHYLVINYIFK